MPDIQTIQQILAPIAEAYGIKKLYLFGSVAAGTATDDSDVDILIEKGEPISLLGLSALRQKCQEALDCPVDLVTTAGIADDFYEEIKGTELLLYEA